MVIFSILFKKYFYYSSKLKQTNNTITKVYGSRFPSFVDNIKKTIELCAELLGLVQERNEMKWYFYPLISKTIKVFFFVIKENLLWN